MNNKRSKILQKKSDVQIISRNDKKHCEDELFKFDFKLKTTEMTYGLTTDCEVLKKIFF